MLNFQSEERQMKCYVDEAGTIEAKAGDAVALLKQDGGAEWLRQDHPENRPINILYSFIHRGHPSEMTEKQIAEVKRAAAEHGITLTDRDLFLD